MEKQAAQDTANWIQVPRPAPQAKTRLICCPHAGASASAFGPLARALPDHDIEALSVQYPGRQGGPGYQGFTDIGELADRVATALLPWCDRPVAVLGHSMGSVVAFELTRRLEAAGKPPVRLFVSGRRSPSDGLGVHVPQDDEEIVEELRTLGGIPVKLLDKPKYRESILAVVRNDYRANSGYLAPSDATVNCPVTFLLSDADPYVDAAAAAAWGNHTTQELTVASFPGGHFFLNEELAQVVEAVSEGLFTGSARRHAGGLQ
ncbi:thioesterase II family protein [Streptomyces halobius]|uniref:Alpha/beta fold hydrolase n=1 Tax=Streptomyces halobius TaxID=2879846 RepID=A0ABY4MCJ0_9ACTN|nr:alpha/beta fold hydrolase [Streptomyces halobius]UQA94120.1 alpha/beta fold hydrolase [Streptomyces halobius]